MAQIEENIMLAVGGNFHPAALGEDEIARVSAEFRQQPDAYLDAFRAMFLGDAFDPQRQSSLALSTALRILAEVRPEQVRAITASLLNQYDAVLILFDRLKDRAALDGVMEESDVNLLFRLNSQRLELRKLLGELTAGGLGGGASP